MTRQVDVFDPMRIVAILFCWLILPRASFAQETSVLIERAEVAVAERRFEDAVELLDRAVNRDGNTPAIHYLLATALADSSVGDIDRARKAIDRAIALDPENITYLEVKLGLMPASTSGFIPFLSEQRRIDLAGRILKLDSTSAIANEQIAIRAYREFREYYRAITFPKGGIGVILTDRFDLDNLRAQIPILDLSDRANENYEKAVSHFGRANSSDPSRRSTYRWLASLFALKEADDDFRDILKTMRSNLPENPEMWLYMGFVASRGASQEDAERYFKRALSLMSEEEALVFKSVGRILRPDADQPQSSVVTDNYWESRDPRLLTEINERRVEHYTRMVYADLAFGGMPSGNAGWDTEQGQLYVRYGAPVEDTVVRVDQSKGFFNGDDAQSFNIWDYGDLKFVFDKPVEMEAYRMYSPSSVAMGGFLTRAGDQDYVIRTRNTIRKTPDRYEHDPDVARMEFPYLVSRFKGGSGLTDILVPFGIRVPFKPRRGTIRMPLTTGAFLMADSSGVVAERRESAVELESYQIFEFEEATTWINVHQFSTQPGDYTVSVEFETETGAIVGFHRSEVDAVAWDTSELTASDILLAYTVGEAEAGEPVPAGFLERNNLLIQPAPWGVFGTDQPLYFYLEAYNLTVGTDGLTNYAMEAALVEKKDESGLERLISGIFGRRSEEGVSVRFEGTGTGTEHGQYLIMDATDQTPGTYVLVVRFTDTVSGETVEKRRVLILE